MKKDLNMSLPKEEMVQDMHTLIDAMLSDGFSIQQIRTIVSHHDTASKRQLDIAKKVDDVFRSTPFDVVQKVKTLIDNSKGRFAIEFRVATKGTSIGSYVVIVRYPIYDEDGIPVGSKSTTRGFNDEQEARAYHMRCIKDFAKQHAVSLGFA